ncbi:MAG: lysophospholipid acyltransferase family protein [Myxococcota bacterium]
MSDERIDNKVCVQRNKRPAARRSTSPAPSACAVDEPSCLSSDAQLSGIFGPEPSQEARPKSDDVSEPQGTFEARLHALVKEAEGVGDPALRALAIESLNRIARTLPDAVDEGQLSQATHERAIGAGGILPPRALVTQAAHERALGRESVEEREVNDATIGSFSKFFEHRWGRDGVRERSEPIDEFGYSPDFEARLLGVLKQMYRRWFRVSVQGIGEIPSQGRAILVANHGGAVPWDGLMLKMAVKLDHPSRHELRWLAEDFIFHTPFVGTFVNRLGAVRACQENAERLLHQDRLVAVFPEGIQGVGRLYSERYRLRRFGRGGYIKLALRSGSPIVPVAIVGAEEVNPLVFKLEVRGLGLPFWPITPTFPLFGPIGLMPAPVKWRILVGSPIDLSRYRSEHAEDAHVVHQLNDLVRAQIQTMVDKLVDERAYRFPSMFGG